MSTPSHIRVALPAAPALVAGMREAAWLSEEGEIERLSLKEAGRRLRRAEACYLVHAGATAARLGVERPTRGFDLLELFAFVRPARFCVPTPRGLAEALSLPMPESLEDAPTGLLRAAHGLLTTLGREAGEDNQAPRIAGAMARGGWIWGPAVLSALGESEEAVMTRAAASGLDVWRRLKEWSEQAPPPPAGDHGIDPSDARRRLAELLGDGAEERPGQADYASAVSAAFAPKMTEGHPNMVLAEAGTGVGKTLGYIAPASLWAERNEAPVWLSTYTRNLQHQIDRELDRLYPEEEEKRQRVVVRKGRENYLCLLNLEEAAAGVQVNGADAVPLGLMARWAGATRDGDMTGGDFPSWLTDLLGPRRTSGLTDRRGECIFTACQHYKKCYIESGIRKARRADLVVANHALVMVQAARGQLDLGGRTTRLVFDEGHHVFDAADSAFSAYLSGLETAELRRWLRGHEGRSRGRARGLKARAEDLLGGGEAAAEALEQVLDAAHALPGDGWMARLAESRPQGAGESFLAALHALVYARAHGRDGPYGLEIEAAEVGEPVLETARALKQKLDRLIQPAERLAALLHGRLDEEADDLDGATRVRIEQVCRSLKHRLVDTVKAWSDMLLALDGETPAAFVDWFAVERIDGRDIDVGMRRHWVDPTLPFAETVAAPSHGLLVTSATLTDGSGDAESEWRSAEARTGAVHLPEGAIRARAPSPFDYPNHTRVFVVNDVRKDDLDLVAAAYRELFKASGGGALGLFTAISRLRGVHRRIAGPLDEAGLTLLGQHVDALNLPTLIEIFRAERDSCLLGTDAVRDGVDVPGESLRLIVFDRVPWPRPTILHKARRKHFGARAYDDALTRLKLKQAFGRLVRQQEDRGVFVLLDPMMPTRLTGAFPEGVEVQRVGLREAVRGTREFLTG
ncbi:ATP-dependent DNA helicase [Marivibrio halodurans]|uniref:ATP-dependent DNA helicase n=1 Tax=Marivibrio halodurans TaxID=2039722 RepID=A0A8J7SHB6_9PROT|nr:ATP-dependent DNA helicase [Marivibrio halodurans]MBP5856298.1 ATP-dependent DNA helicase [Marivibrio halodurans]